MYGVKHLQLNSSDKGPGLQILSGKHWAWEVEFRFGNWVLGFHVSFQELECRF